jgi:hypothetical protein
MVVERGEPSDMALFADIGSTSAVRARNSAGRRTGVYIEQTRIG